MILQVTCWCCRYFQLSVTPSTLESIRIGLIDDRICVCLWLCYGRCAIQFVCVLRRKHSKFSSITFSFHANLVQLKLHTHGGSTISIFEPVEQNIPIRRFPMKTKMFPTYLIGGRDLVAWRDTVKGKEIVLHSFELCRRQIRVSIGYNLFITNYAISPSLPLSPSLSLYLSISILSNNLSTSSSKLSIQLMDLINGKQIELTH